MLNFPVNGGLRGATSGAGMVNPAFRLINRQKRFYSYFMSDGRVAAP